MSQPSDVIGRKMFAVSREVAGAQRNALTRASMELKKSIEAERNRVAPSGRLRNVGRGAKLGVGFTIKGDTSITKARGPWQIIEENTKPHRIGPKARRRRGGRAAVRLPDGGIRRSVFHPGTKGKHPFAKGVKAGEPRIVKELRDVYVRALVKGFRR